MKKQEIINIQENKVIIHKILTVPVLSEIQSAMDSMVENETWKAEVELSWADLQYIKRLLIADEVSTQIAAHNLYESMERKAEERKRAIWRRL